jgi:lipopolysaccharide/colanic/teichoic acid biosynthesis glycosyltransferase
MQLFAKRFFDVLLAGALLIIVAPVLVVCAILVAAINPGSPIFAQTREGRNRRPFTLYKLRTMYLDADERLATHLASSEASRTEWLAYRRLAADPRVIPGIGRYLRRWSLDELPQLWNVLVGDMSLVGPRPLELEVANRLPDDTRDRRASVRPGLTGLWQVSGRSEMDIAAMVAIDDAYLRDWGIQQDVAILARTPLAALSRRGAY